MTRPRACRGDARGQVPEPECDIGRDDVTVLLGQTGEARQVQERDRRLRIRADRDVAGRLEHLLGRTDAVVVDRPADVAGCESQPLRVGTTRANLAHGRK